MAETLVEKKICDACGADVRAGSLYCYNCGGPVALELAEPRETNKISSAWLKSDLNEGVDLQTTRLDLPAAAPAAEPAAEPAAPAPSPRPTVGELLEETAPAATSASAETQLKSAANMRRRAKSFQREPVEIVWEEPENAPHKWFVLVAVVLILFVVGLFFLAMYLR